MKVIGREFYLNLRGLFLRDIYLIFPILCYVTCEQRHKRNPHQHMCFLHLKQMEMRQLLPHCLDGSYFQVAAGPRNWSVRAQGSVRTQGFFLTVVTFYSWPSPFTAHCPSTEILSGKKFFTALVVLMDIFHPFCSSICPACFRPKLEFPCLQPSQPCHWAPGIRSQRSHHAVRERMEEVETVGGNIQIRIKVQQIAWHNNRAHSRVIKVLLRSPELMDGRIKAP